jgi:hypothetical protein
MDNVIRTNAFAVVLPRLCFDRRVFHLALWCGRVVTKDVAARLTRQQTSTGRRVPMLPIARPTQLQFD